MAKSRASKPEKTVPISTGTAVLDEPEPPQGSEPDDIPAEQVSEPPKREPPKVPSFFQTMGRVQKEDWGPRASIYLYRLEPMIDRLRGGDKKYIMMYTEPLTEERIMVDHGSGRYKAVLNIRKAGAERGDEIDSHFFDIMNLKYPPKVPKGEWVDDPRNKKWAWAKEPDLPPAPPASGLAEFTGVFRAANEFRKEIREEMTPPAAPTETRTDPLTASLTIAREILQIRSDNPMVDVLRDELKGLRDEMKEERAENRKLQEEIRKAQAQPIQTQPAAAPKTLLEQATELAEAAGKLRSIFGTASETGPMGQVVRAAKMGTLEFLADVIPKIAEAPIMNAWAARLMMPTPVPTDGITGAPEIQPRPAPTPPNSDSEFLNFMRYAITPALLEYFEAEQTGQEFALLVNNAYPDRLSQLQNFHHPMIPGMAGPPAIIAAYRNTGLWPRLSARGEEAFTTFVQQFCAWKPEGEESPPQGTAPPSASGEPIDLDEETREAV